MPLGTLDRTPPPFFRQGFSARSKLVFFAALAVFLMVADRRLQLLDPARAVVATALLPVQRVLAVPVDLVTAGADYLMGLQQAQEGRREAQAQLAALSERATRAEQLALENARLRALLELRAAVVVRSVPAEVLYEAADPFSRKVFIDRGRAHGVVPGAPVINESGVIGQVTQAYALNAEVTLLTDRDAAIPVLNTRTQQRHAAFGGGAPGSGGMELRFVYGETDVQPGDLLHTSGVDGVYPPGLPVARVLTVQRRADAGFARITLAPVAPPDGVRHVLVLEPLALQLPPRPQAAASAPEEDRPERQLTTPRRTPAAP